MDLSCILLVKVPTKCNSLIDLSMYIAYSTMGLNMQYAIINTNHLIKRAINFHGRNARTEMRFSTVPCTLHIHIEQMYYFIRGL